MIIYALAIIGREIHIIKTTTTTISVNSRGFLLIIIYAFDLSKNLPIIIITAKVIRYHKTSILWEKHAAIIINTQLIMARIGAI